MDRLARRVLDFLNANDAVKARGAGLVAVEDPIDMTTPQGEAFAIMLAVFAQLEADTTRARVLAARDHLMRSGRYVGGALPYGYRAVPNPTGPGYVIDHDPEAIDYLRGMVRRTQEGRTVYSTTQWLNEVGAPTASMLRVARGEEAREEPETDERARPGRVARSWSYNTVDRVLRHPLLAGMVPHNSGTSEYRRRGNEVVRDEDGLPVVDERLAIMGVAAWRAMVARLDAPNPDDRRKAPRPEQVTSGALSGLMWCHDGSTAGARGTPVEVKHTEPVRMYRGKTYNRDTYYCPSCNQTLSNTEPLLIEEFLRVNGDRPRIERVQVVREGGSVQYEEATHRLAELGREMVTAEPDRALAIVGEMQRLKEIQAEAKAQPASVREEVLPGPDTWGEAWAACNDDTERRALLGQAIQRIEVRRGGQGKWSDADKMARCRIVWFGAVAATPEDAADFAAHDEYMFRATRRRP